MKGNFTMKMQENIRSNKSSHKDSEVAFKKDESWYHNVKILNDDGSVKYGKRIGFKSKEEAEKSYYEYADKFNEAKLAIIECKSTDFASMSFKGYLEYWFEEIFSERIESTTRMLNAYVLYNIIEPQLKKDIQLKYVNYDYLNTVLESASKVTPSAGNKSRELLRVALNEAVQMGIIRNNPINATKKYPRKKSQITIFNKEQIRLFLDASKRSPWYLEILLALFAGLRKGEILGLHFSDINIDAGTVSIKRQLANDYDIKKGSYKIDRYSLVEKEPKTQNSYRTLRLPKEIIEEVEQRKAFVEKNKREMGSLFRDNDYVSCQEDGNPHHMASMNNAISKICDRNALPRITPHGLRHNFATILLEQGVAIATISALMGHESVNTTFEYYCDVMDDENRIIHFLNENFK